MTLRARGTSLFSSLCPAALLGADGVTESVQQSREKKAQGFWLEDQDRNPTQRSQEMIGKSGEIKRVLICAGMAQNLNGKLHTEN